MTKQELVSRRQEFRRGINRLGILLIISISAMIGGCIVGLCVEGLYGQDTRISGVIGFCVLLGTIAPLVVAFLRHRRLIKRFDVKCPHCGTQFLGVTGEIAVASGNCGSCGERVVD